LPPAPAASLHQRFLESPLVEKCAGAKSSEIKMANGAAVVRSFPLEPQSTLAAQTLTSKLPIEVAEGSATELELEIGKLVAQAAFAVCMAVEQCREGKSTIMINTRGAEIIARLYALQSAAPNIDFARAGRCELRRILGQNVGVAEALCRQFSLDEVLDTIVSWPLGVLAQVTADEQDRLRSQ
jgi:hypothetical protein